MGQELCSLEQGQTDKHIWDTREKCELPMLEFPA